MKQTKKDVNEGEGYDGKDVETRKLREYGCFRFVDLKSTLQNNLFGGGQAEWGAAFRIGGKRPSLNR